MQTSIMRILIYTGEQDVLNEAMIRRTIKGSFSDSAYTITEVFMDELPQPEFLKVEKTAKQKIYKHLYDLDITETENKEWCQAMCNHDSAHRTLHDTWQCTNCGLEALIAGPKHSPEGPETEICKHPRLLKREDGKGVWYPECGHKEVL